MNRTDFQQLAEVRVHEARILLEAGCLAGSYYLAGYAVECALKACIARQTKQYDFPDKQLVDRIYKHNPKELLKAAGLEKDLEEMMRNNKHLERNWAVVLKWTEESRYEPVRSEGEAKDLFLAISDVRDGVLPWLKKRW